MRSKPSWWQLKTFSELLWITLLFAKMWTKVIRKFEIIRIANTIPFQATEWQIKPASSLNKIINVSLAIVKYTRDGRKSKDHHQNSKAHIKHTTNGRSCMQLRYPLEYSQTHSHLPRWRPIKKLTCPSPVLVAPLLEAAKG